MISRSEGVSGASAGAITALLITIGHSALSLWSLLKRRHDFEALYDAPFPGLLRGVVASQPVRVFNRNLGVKDEAGREQVVRRRVQSEIPVLYGIIPFKQLIRRAKDKAAFIKKIAARESELAWYLYNIFYDRGLFPGFEFRNYITTLVMDFYGRLPFAAALTFAEVKQRASRLSFSQLKTLTGIDLVVTGTNVTARQVA